MLDNPLFARSKIKVGDYENIKSSVSKILQITHLLVKHFNSFL